MNRAAFLSAAVGLPWDWQNRNCWSFAKEVQRELFGRDLPALHVPRVLDRRWVVREFAGNAERQRWSEVKFDATGVVAAQDGAFVLMAHLQHPAHIGVWLAAEQAVIHCSESYGVLIEGTLALRQQGWRKLTFLEPV